MTKRRLVAFAILAVSLSTALAVGGLLAVDLYLHSRHGINLWGYRGPAVGPKQPAERRIAVLGGSTAFGYGVPAMQAFPAYLERKLTEIRGRRGQGPVSVVNLAFNNEGAYSFRFTLRDYEYLGYDVVLLYTGYNDLGGRKRELNTRVVRQSSIVFRLTGYWPLIPVVLGPKAMAMWRKVGPDPRTVFRPDLAQRGPAGALAAAEISRSLESQVGRLTRLPDAEPVPTGARCVSQWAGYCSAIEAVVRYAVDRGADVLVVTEPYISDRHVEQQRALSGMLRDRFGGDRRVRLVNLGRTVDVRDRSLVYDGMHLTPAGNERIADALVPRVLEVIEAGLASR